MTSQDTEPFGVPPSEQTAEDADLDLVEPEDDEDFDEDDEPEYGHFYDSICDIVCRAIEKTHGREITDNLMHTSDESRWAASRITELIMETFPDEDD